MKVNRGINVGGDLVAQGGEGWEGFLRTQKGTELHAQMGWGQTLRMRGQTLRMGWGQTLRMCGCFKQMHL